MSTQMTKASTTQPLESLFILFCQPLQATKQNKIKNSSVCPQCILGSTGPDLQIGEEGRHVCGPQLEKSLNLDSL